MTEAPDIVTEALAVYLKAEIPELTVLSEWPDPKHKFTFPTLSIIGSGNRGYRNEQPTIHSQTQNDSNPDHIDVAYTIGQYDYKLQLDIWSDYKEQRSVLFKKVKDALNKDFITGDSPCGLSLKLPQYHDLIARFDQVGYTYLDNEESAQRSEWRVKVEVEVCHSDLQVKTEAKMIDIQVHSEISDTTDPSDDELNDEEITEI